MYGTYAAKAFLRSNVAPLTYVRLLGTQNVNNSTAGEAGWETTKTLAAGARRNAGAAGTLNFTNNGGAYGLWVWASGSAVTLGTGSLAAIWYVDASSSVYLSGTVRGPNESQRHGGGDLNLGGKATATIVTVAEAQLVDTKDFTLTNAGGVTITFNFTGGKATSTNTAAYDATSDVTVDIGYSDLASGSPSATGDEIVARINAGTGIDMTATKSGANVIVTQGTKGTVGNKTNTQESGHHADFSVGNFSGGHDAPFTDSGIGRIIASDSNGNFTVVVTGASNLVDNVTFNFDDTSENFIRKKFNTNPLIGNVGASDFYPAESEKTYWLGETFEHEVRDAGSVAGCIGKGTDLTTAAMHGVMLPIASGSSAPSDMTNVSYNEAVAGWFIGQDLGAAGQYTPEAAQKLFRLVGRGHGEWLHKNVKVSIANIRASTSLSTDYGSFSILLRSIRDTDNNVVVLERFDNLTLDPTSPNYIARRIGDVYYQWDSTARRLKEYGSYPNLSKYVYVEVNEDVDQGSTDAVLLPFGYYAPPKFKNVLAWDGVIESSQVQNRYIYVSTTIGTGSRGGAGAKGKLLSASVATTFEGSLTFPSSRLRHSASDGGLADQTDAYFGFFTNRTATSTVHDSSVADAHRMWLPTLNSDPVGSSIAGVDSFAYIFSLDDIVAHSSDGGYYYLSGSRRRAGGSTSPRSYTGQSGNSYKTLLDAGYRQFTAPMWGGFDGVDITKPDPFYNKSMTDGSSTEVNSYVYNTYKRAIDTVGDPELNDMNLLAVPGLTLPTLTGHMVTVCEERADALAIIDLPDVYVPTHEQKLTKPNRRSQTTPSTAANSLRDRRIDSSYGCTFYPWVQTRDEATGQLLWIPPSVAMLGVLGSSQAASDVWFAPAGFNRGGLTDGAAGITITNVTERLTSKDRDTLYENRINPIAAFPSTGIVVFGQKTLQERQSALDRINVRRLVIFLKKQISILSTQVLFEQNVQATWTRFKGLIEPFLANVKVQFGITEYRLILDDTTTTPDLIYQNIMYAKIMVKPARAIEFIAIDFVIASTGASFDD